MKSHIHKWTKGCDVSQWRENDRDRFFFLVSLYNKNSHNNNQLEWWQKHWEHNCICNWIDQCSSLSNVRSLKIILCILKYTAVVSHKVNVESRTSVKRWSHFYCSITIRSVKDCIARSIQCSCKFNLRLYIYIQCRRREREKIKVICDAMQCNSRFLVDVIVDMKISYPFAWNHLNEFDNRYGNKHIARVLKVRRKKYTTANKCWWHFYVLICWNSVNFVQNVSPNSDNVRFLTKFSGIKFNMEWAMLLIL